MLKEQLGELSMIIRELRKEDFSQAIDLRITSFDEQLQGSVPNTMNKEDDLRSMIEWIDSAQQNNDVRLLYGAFENDIFLGFAGASIADESDSKNGIELNYLFVKEEFRGKGISLKLISELLSEFSSKSFEEVVVYNFNIAASNKYYRKLGGKVINEISVMEDQLLIDVFSFDFEGLKSILETMIAERYNC